MNRTKTIATIGPACANVNILQKLIDLGVVCFRINLSHGSDKEKEEYFDLVRSLQAQHGLRPTILADLSGPKIRVSNLEKSINLSRGEKIKISNEEVATGVIPVSKEVRFKKVNPGAQILIDDGRNSLKVVEHVSD